MRPAVRWLLGLVMLLGLVTEVSFYPLLRYCPEGPELLTNPQFGNAAEGWTGNALQRGGTLIEGGVMLRNLDRGRLFLAQELSVQPGSRLLISAQVSSRGVIPGARPWELARINLIQRDAAGNPLATGLGPAVALRGDQPWRQRVAARTLAERARSVSLVVAMTHAEGDFRVRALSVREARVNTEFLWLGRLSLAGWVFAGLMAALLQVRGSARRWHGLVVVLLAGAILLMLTLPRGATGSIPQLGLNLVAELRDLTLHLAAPAPSTDAAAVSQQGPRPEFTWLAADKLAHVLAFALLALVVRILYPGTPLWRATLYLLVLALASEELQHFTAARGAGLEDFGSDVVGVAAGLLAAGAGSGLVRGARRRFNPG
jgi:VanZ family protein